MLCFAPTWRPRTWAEGVRTRWRSVRRTRFGAWAAVACTTRRGGAVRRQMCMKLGPSDVYRSVACVLLAEGDPEFVCRMVHLLNSILLTATELFELRDKLRLFDGPVRRPPC